MTRSIKENNNKLTSSSESNHKMASLHRFKLLATQCGVAPSPTRSPRTSPVIHLRRRRTTLRAILLGRRPPPETKKEKPPEALAVAAVKRRNSLKELFSSPPLEVQSRALTLRNNHNFEEKPSISLSSSSSSSLIRVGSGSGSPRPGWSGFRYRSLLLRRVWRPVLVTIPE